MSSNDGSAAIREAIEAKRSKIKTPGVSLKTLARDAERKKKWWNEKITIAYLDEDGEPVPECQWKVPRRLLTETFLQTICLKCPLKVKVGHLKDRTTGDIIWPPDAQLSCNTLPWSYAVVAVEEKEVIDRSRDPSYYGDVQIVIFDVPLKTDNDRMEVSADDIKAWLMCGLAEEDEKIKEAQEIVHTLEREVKVVDNSLSRVGYMKFTQKTGMGRGEKQLCTDEEQAELREERNQALSAQREKMEEDLADARAVLEKIKSYRQNIPITLEKAKAFRKRGSCTYYVSITGYEGAQLEDVVCAKTDWPGIKLATAHDDLPPWAGRGEIPDGSKPYIKRYTEHSVNMRAAQICRLQHGFGQTKVARVARISKEPENCDPTVDHPGAGTPARLSAPKSPVRSEGTRSNPVSRTNTPATCTGAQSQERPRESQQRQRQSSRAATSTPASPNTTRQTTSRPSTAGPATARSGATKSARGVQSEQSSPSGFEETRSGGEGQGGGGDVPFAGEAFSFFQGEFQEGIRAGFGLELTEAGVYHGEYRGDRRCGVGVLHCANGDHIEGNFVSETRFPEAGHAVNPYREGVPHGPVEIRFASGGTYKGDMKHGRITGRGDFVSCLGERCSGDIVDGRLHGQGSLLNVIGQTYEGQWYEGDMDGQGRHSASETGEFEGDWVKGEWQGKGKLVLKGGNTYEGFLLDHGRSGLGILLKGNVKSVYDPRSGRLATKSYRVYEGNWRASELRSGSMVTLTKSGDMYCIGNGNESGWYNRAVDRLKRRERQIHRKTIESLDFYGRYETLLRIKVEKKKARIFAKQARAANQDLVDDYHKKLDADGLKAAYRARAINVEQTMRVNGKTLEGNDFISQAVERLEQIAASRGTTSNQTLLSSLVQSRLEEAQELQQLVNITETAASAESAAHAQQAELG